MVVKDSEAARARSSRPSSWNKRSATSAGRRSAEGEGDSCLEDWRAGHRRYFTRNGGFAPDMMLWCERFRLVEIIGEGAER